MSDPITNENIQVPGSSTSPDVEGNSNTVNVDWETIKNNSSVMIAYATKRGIALPPKLPIGEEQSHLNLLETYNALIPIVAPATPASIKYINDSMAKHGRQLKWYEFPILTKCLVIATMALIAMIGISLFPQVNAENQARGLLNSSGWILFYNLVFICSASLMGVMFYLLKTISTKIRNYTLKEEDSIEINGSILIGVISGFIIAELFTFSVAQFTGDIEIQKMTLALLGGFSADAIFTIIQNFVNRVKALFSNK